ncbi:MAG: thioredoxin family protein [Thiothrix sp.]|uniref:thioredoxin family protein n=1 Tax=Thiothrix sp. TaxID=1032 RepID=UPI0026150E69|nr:thioredoxin family protein [Thiothrix sp.]MDD5394177.1 thioredoxin family protein [Thiothrix sp.]
MPAMTKIASLTDLNFHHVLEETPGAALVFFTAPNCGACRSLKRALEKFLHTHSPLPVFEVDAVHNGGLVNALDIFHLPALFLYVDGHYHCELKCEALPARIHHAIQTALSQPAEDEP